MPVAIYLEAMAHVEHSKNKLLNVANGKAASLEGHCGRLERNAKKTQDYIQREHGRLEQAAADGLTVAAYLEQDRERAREHWRRGRSV